MELIHEEDKKKYYKLDFNVYVSVKGKNLKELYEKFLMNFKDGVIVHSKFDKFDTICISDAHTHCERLVFPAYRYTFCENVNKLSHTYDEIAGTHTMMIFGGDTNHHLEAEEYIEQLREANKNFNK